MAHYLHRKMKPFDKVSKTKTMNKICVSRQWRHCVTLNISTLTDSDVSLPTHGYYTSVIKTMDRQLREFYVSLGHIAHTSLYLCRMKNAFPVLSGPFNRESHLIE